MNRIDFENKITMYINGELNHKEKIDFEKAMDKNSTLKNLFNDILQNDEALNNLPHITVSADFMFNLNSRIEEYKDQKNRTWYNIIKQFSFNLKPAPTLTIACVALVACFSIIKISDYNLFPNFLGPQHKYNIDLNNYIAVNDSDSLSSTLDSLGNPILLIGNDR